MENTAISMGETTSASDTGARIAKQNTTESEPSGEVIIINKE